MLGMLKKYRVAIIIALSFTLIELTVELFQPYLIAKIIDDGIVAGHLPTIWGWGGVLLAATAVSFVCGILNSYYSAHASQGFGYDLREKLYEKVQRFSFAVFNKLAPSTYMTRLTNDVQQIQNTLFMSLRIMVRAPLVVIGSVIMAIVVNPRLGFFLVISAPVLFVFVMWIMRKASGLFRKVQQQLDQVNATMRENLQAIRLVRAFNREERENSRFRKQARHLSDDTQSALRWSETTMPTVMLVTNASIVAVLWFGGSQIQLEDAKVGEVVAVVNYALRTGGVLSMMSWIIMSFARAKASVERVGEVFALDEGTVDNHAATPAEQVAAATEDEAPVAGEDGAAMDGQLAFRRVSFRYPQSADLALADISFEAAPGERIAILGATGSGKSSLFQLVPRLYEVTEGDIVIGGKNIADWDLVALRRAIGYVSQETILFTGTVRENIAWGNPGTSQEAIEQAARDAQIHEAIMQFPQGYDTMIGQRGINLSGGQKQRMAIARALVRKPSILLLDDSTSALDTRTEAALLGALGKYEATILLITQKVTTAMQSDHILLLDEGRLVAAGSHEQLLKQSELYRKIVASQNGKEAMAGA